MCVCVCVCVCVEAAQFHVYIEIYIIGVERKNAFLMNPHYIVYFSSHERVRFCCE